MIIYSPTFTGSVQITGSQIVTGDFTVQGNLTAQTFILSSSVSYFTESFASGSTRFGDSMDDTMVVTGSLRLTGSMTSIGNVGIGTTVALNPSAYDANRRFLTIRSTTGGNDRGAFIELIGTAGGSPDFWNGGLVFSNTNATNWLSGIYSWTDSGGSTGNLIFNTSGSAGGLSEKMRITGDGKVGIGSTTPSSKLVLLQTVSTSTPSLDIRNDNGSGTNASVLTVNNPTSYANFQATLGASRAVLDVGTFGDGTGTAFSAVFRGSVGIGITNPGFQLSMKIVGTANALLAYYNAAGSATSYIGIPNAAGDVISTSATSDFCLRNETGNILFATNGNSERMRITNAGNVVIAGANQVGSAKLSVVGIISAQSSGVDGTYQESFVANYTSNTNESNAILTAVSSVAAQSGFQFAVSNGGGSSARTVSMTVNRSSVNVVGTLSKGGGSFKIDHPHPSKKDTHYLLHSFIEGPTPDLIYRGVATLVNGTATINIDEVSDMTEGTFVLLNKRVQCFTTNESSWDAVKGKVEGNILTITSQNSESTDEISWMVIGERNDEWMKNSEMTDENGKIIVELLKPTPPTE